MANERIKEAAANRGVHLYEIAKKLGIADTTWSKRLREELPEDRKAEVLRLIEEIAAEKDQSRRCSIE